MYGFVTDSPLFDKPGGFYRPLTNEEDIRLRGASQRAMEAGRPMTMAEMRGKPQQLFRKLGGFGEDSKGLTMKQGAALLVGILSAAALMRWRQHLPEPLRRVVPTSARVADFAGPMALVAIIVGALGLALIKKKQEQVKKK